MCRVVCILKNFSLYSNLYQKAREPLGDRLDVNINYTRYKKKNIKILYVKYKKKFISFFLSLFLKNTYLIEAIDQVGHELNIESIINKNSEYICEKFVLSFFDFILHENIILKKNKNIQFGIICKEKKYLSSKILNYTCNFYNIMKYLPCKKNVYVINNHRQHLFFSKTSYKTIKFFNKFTHSKVFFFSFPNKFLFLKKIKCLLSLGNFLFLKFFSKKNKTLFAIISGFFLLLNFIGKQLIPVRMNIILVNLKHIISKKKANFSRYFKVKRSSAFFLLFENLLFKNVKSSRHMFFFLFFFFSNLIKSATKIENRLKKKIRFKNSPLTNNKNRNKQAKKGGSLFFLKNSLYLRTFFSLKIIFLMRNYSKIFWKFCNFLFKLSLFIKIYSKNITNRLEFRAIVKYDIKKKKYNIFTKFQKNRLDLCLFFSIFKDQLLVGKFYVLIVSQWKKFEIYFNIKKRSFPKLKLILFSRSFAKKNDINIMQFFSAIHISFESIVAKIRILFFSVFLHSFLSKKTTYMPFFLRKNVSYSNNIVILSINLFDTINCLYFIIYVLIINILHYFN